MKISPDLPHLLEEQRLGYPKLRIAGADEVGRGCLAGPVVGAAVLLPSKIDFSKDPWIAKIKDSKKLSAATREELAPLIQKWARAWAIGVASVQEIDEMNIFHASHLAIVRAIDLLQVKPHHVLIDGKFIPKKSKERNAEGSLKIPATPVIKGDLQCLSIAAASILAKVYRDQLMLELENEYPGYGFAKNKGYPTRVHTEALLKKGITEHHRRSFKPVSRLSE